MTERHGASFRDPSGFVFERQGTLFRQVNPTYLSTYRQLIDSGLYADLVEAGLLVAHDEVDVAPAEPFEGEGLVLQPQRVAFISYPYEWSPGQLQAAALATLRVQRMAMARGMSLKDASAYNVQFVDGRPVLIDTLSFEPLVEGQPWVAYAQYCRHFLAPLALMRSVDVRLGGLARTHIDGIPLDLASRLLPRRTRWSWGLGIHIHAHAKSQSRHADTGQDVPASFDDPKRPRKVSTRALTGLIQSLEAVTQKQKWAPRRSTWRDYYAKRESYTEASLDHKLHLVEDLFKQMSVAQVWDLGANTGKFSALVARASGANVVALEMDPSAVEVHWRQLQGQTNHRVLPLVTDLANPAPDQGWAHRERSSLEARGPADAVLALALIHHLAIGNNVPLASLMSWFARLGENLVIEWIPKDDPMVQRLLASRVDVFEDYNEQAFKTAAKRHFDVVEVLEIEGSQRRLYVLARR